MFFIIDEKTSSQHESKNPTAVGRTGHSFSIRGRAMGFRTSGGSFTSRLFVFHLVATTLRSTCQRLYIIIAATKKKLRRTGLRERLWAKKCCFTSWRLWTVENITSAGRHFHHAFHQERLGKVRLNIFCFKNQSDFFFFNLHLLALYPCRDQLLAFSFTF